MTAVYAALDTPHPVFALQWSADGERLGFCGGFLYGGGFIGLADAEGRLLTLRDMASLGAEPLVGERRVILSGLCFDDSGGWLLAAASGYKWHAEGPLLFRVVDDRLVLAAAPELPDDDELRQRGPATGVWLHRGRMLVRYRAREPAHALVSWEAPDGLHADAQRAHLANARIAIIDDVAWVAKNLQRVYSHSGTGPAMTPDSQFRLIVNPHGLISFDLREEAAAPQQHDTGTEAFCTALVRNRAGTRLYTGLDDYHIAEWQLGGRQQLARIRTWRHPSAEPRPVVVKGIQALCMLADGDTLVSAELGGHVALWRDGVAVDGWELPPGWSPRSLAAHPTRPLLAVGCKGAYGQNPGVVLIYDLGSRGAR